VRNSNSKSNFTVSLSYCYTAVVSAQICRGAPCNVYAIDVTFEKPTDYKHTDLLLLLSW